MTPVPSAARLAKLISTNPGLITTKEPTNPMITAAHLLKPTFSFRRIGEKAVTINGAINAKVNAFAKDMTEIA